MLFKVTIEKKKEQERTATPDLEVQAWKHAAGEIVGLLGRVRNEGTDCEYQHCINIMQFLST